VDAVTFSISAALVALGVPKYLGRVGEHRREVEHRYVAQVAVGLPSGPGGGGDVASVARNGGYLSGLTEGLRFIRASTVLLSVVLVATIGNSLDKPLMYSACPEPRAQADGTNVGSNVARTPTAVARPTCPPLHRPSAPPGRQAGNPHRNKTHGLPRQGSARTSAPPPNAPTSGPRRHVRITGRYSTAPGARRAPHEPAIGEDLVVASAGSLPVV
jgi:hypothetical protein